MSDPEIASFDIKKLERMLQDSITGGYILFEPRERSFLRRRNRRGVDYYIIQDCERFFGLDYEETIGKVCIRSDASFGVNDDDVESTVSLTFRTYNPLTLRGGVKLPQCKIRLFYDESEGFRTSIQRQDYRTGFLFWTPDDFSEQVPTDWFL